MSKIDAIVKDFLARKKIAVVGVSERQVHRVLPHR